MPFQAMNAALGITIPKRTLLQRAQSLEDTVGATPTKQSLSDETDQWSATLASVKASPFWCDKVEALLRLMETESANKGKSKEEEQDQGAAAAAARKNKHTVTTVTADELPNVQHPDLGTEATPTMAGYELAKWLRSRGVEAVHVLPKLEPVFDDVDMRTGFLIKLVASLVRNLVCLVPESGTWASSSLNHQRFQELEAGNMRSLYAGLKILGGLPRLDWQDRWKLVIIVDALDMAFTPQTAAMTQRFHNVLYSVCVKNEAHLIYTLENNIGINFQPTATHEPAASQPRVRL